MLELRTFGPLGLTVVGQAVEHPLLSHPKGLAVLAYLASPPRRPHRRDSLCAIFWPELDQPRARAALRQLLHAMRRVLGNSVITNAADDALVLDPLEIWCDVQAFVDEATAGDPRRALELYRGDFLDGFFLSGSAEFEQWTAGERARLCRLAGDAAARAVASCSASGDNGRALEFARRRVSLVEDDEDAHRELVRLLDAIGDRAGALRAYHALEQRLAEEFGCEPAPETRALAAAVRDRVDPRWQIPPAASEPETRPHDEPPAGDDTPPSATTIRARSRILAATAVVVALAGATLALTRAARVDLSPRRVVVATFENRTSDTSIDRLGDMAAEWVRQGLAATGLVEVADGPLLSPVNEHGAGDVEALARQAGAGIVIDGRFYAAGDSLRFEAAITDARRHRVVRNIDHVVGPRGDPERVVGSLRQRVMAALATVMDSSLATWAAAASPPPNYEAYEDFAAGMQAYNLLDPVTATAYFRRAAARDSTYSLPLVFIATTANGLHHCATTDSIADLLARRHHALPPLDRNQLEIAVNRCHGDLVGTYRAARRMADELPASDFAFATLGHYAVLADRPREALAAFQRVDPTRGAARNWPPYYVWVTRALHQLGEHEEELRQAQAGRRQYPGQIGILRDEAIALASLGRAREVNAVLDSLAALRSNPFHKPDRIMQEVGAELSAHGHPADGREVLERTLRWYAALPAVERDAPTKQFEIARTLYMAKRFGDARAYLDRLAAGSPDSVRFLGLEGAVSATMGDSARARAMDQQLQHIDRPYLHGRASYWRACIAAARGERDRAVALVRDALAQGVVFPEPEFWLHADPCFESLRGYPAFAALERPEG